MQTDATVTAQTTHARTRAALSLSALEGFDPHAPRGSDRRRFLCPHCGPDHALDAAHRSLTVEMVSGLFHCHRCGASGKLREFWTERPPTPRRDHRTQVRAAGAAAFGLRGAGTPPAASSRRVGPHSGTRSGDVTPSDGFEPAPGPEAPSKALRRRLTAPLERRYAVRDAAGHCHAVHVRIDGPDGRRIWWELPNGARIPGAVKPTTLPLYGAHELPAAGARVALVEGETSRDALARLGLPAVATVCGASAVMCDESLSVLRGYRVVLWPDNDAPGIEHMRRHGLALLRLGVEVAGSVSWTRYAAGDAADLVLEHRDHLEVAFLDAVELLEDAIRG